MKRTKYIKYINSFEYSLHGSLCRGSDSNADSTLRARLTNSLVANLGINIGNRMRNKLWG